MYNLSSVMRKSKNLLLVAMHSIGLIFLSLSLSHSHSLTHSLSHTHTHTHTTPTREDKKGSIFINYLYN